MNQTVFIVDDDPSVLDSQSVLLESAGHAVRGFASGRLLLSNIDASVGCIIVDVFMPGMSGLEIQATLQSRGLTIPLIFLTGHGDVPTAVQALKAGALNFLLKPIEDSILLDSVRRALEIGQRASQKLVARDCVTALTMRERALLELLSKGLSSRIIADQLGISKRTVDVHRMHINSKLGVNGIAETTRIALESGVIPPDSSIA